MRQSLSSGCTSLFTNALAMSLTKATGFALNLSRASNIKGVKAGPTCKQSFNDTPVLSLHEASKTLCSLVFSVFSCITAL